MKICVFTLGCKVNASESDSIVRDLIGRGYEVTEELEPADLYIINTCAVTAEAEKKSRQTAARAAKLNPNAKIVFTGCACQKNAAPFAEKKNAQLVTGVFGKGKIPDMLEERGILLSPEDKEFEELLPPLSDRARSYIKVQDGCNNFCSYCIIPYLRGRTRSRSPESVLQEVCALSSAEIVLNGINLSAYDYRGKKLKDLVLALKDVNKRVRLGSLEVNVVDEEFLSALTLLKDFAPQFHLSLQSGSDAVLKKMNRHYTAEEYLEKVRLIRSFFPFAGITTDIIAGFPSETEENFEETLRLVDRAEFSDIHCFCYSPRSGTLAYKMPDLPAEVKRDRLERLMKKKELCRARFEEKNLGRTEKVVVEEQADGYFAGYTGNYLRAYLKEALPNEEVSVIIKERFKDGVLCEKFQEE